MSDSREPSSWSRPPEDLSGERVLRNCPKIGVDGEARPSVGRIALLSKIGHGGMGVVYHGVNPRLGTEVAIKVLPLATHAQQEALIERFLREARLAARLQSPHLVSVLDVDEDQDSGCHFIVMEYVHGTDAKDWANRYVRAGHAGAPEAEALDICIAATKGLAAAHLEGVVHRDIKPGNILVPSLPDGSPDPAAAKLADLGLARSDAAAERSLTGTALAMGTPGYMAPEQANDAKRAKKPADVFGMGATLYALLTGRAPFAASSPAMALVATVQGEYPDIRVLRPDLSPGTVKLIETCLATAPGERFPDAPALLEALEVCRRALGETTPTLDYVTVVASLVTRSEQGKRVVTDSDGSDAEPMLTEDVADDLYDRVVRGGEAGEEIGSATRVAAADAVEQMDVQTRREEPAAPASGRKWAVGALLVLVSAVLAIWQPWASSGDDVTQLPSPDATAQQPSTDAPPAPSTADSDEPDEPPAEPPGLYVTSDPDGAAVEVDGRQEGFTPLLVPNLAAGRHEVRLTLDGHDDWSSADVRTELDERTPLHGELVRAKSPARIAGGPPGAVVVLTSLGDPAAPVEYTLDPEGRTTISALETGAYRVVASLDGYRTFEGELVVRKGSEGALELDMPPLPALLTIHSDPTGADVLDGDILLGATPLDSLEVQAGEERRVLSVRAPEHVTWQREVALGRGESVDLGTVVLQPWGTLDLAEVGAGVTASIEGETVTGTFRVPPVGVRVELTRAGCVAQTHDVRVAPGTTQAMSPNRWESLTGSLDLSPLEPGVTVLLEGRVLNNGAQLPPGTYQLTLRRPRHVDVSQSVTVRAGESARPTPPAWQQLPARLDLSALSSDVVVTWNGRVVAHNAILPPGVQALALRRPGYTDERQTVRAVPGEAAPVPAPRWRAKKHGWSGFGVGSFATYVENVNFKGLMRWVKKDTLTELTDMVAVLDEDWSMTVYNGKPALLRDRTQTERKEVSSERGWPGAQENAVPVGERKYETITVPAGTFRCWVVGHANSRTWLSEEVPGGLVKRQITDADFGYRSVKELTGFKIK